MFNIETDPLPDIGKELLVPHNGAIDFADPIIARARLRDCSR